MRWTRVVGLGRRKRSRSPPVGIPRLRRFTRKRSPNGSGSWSSAPNSFRIFYRTSGSDDEKAFSLAIPSDVLKAFSQVDVSREHHRLHLTRSGSLSSLKIYPDCYSSLPSFPDGLPLGTAAVVGSTLYALFFGGSRDAPGKLMSLNLDYPHAQAQSWKQIPGPLFLEPGVPMKDPKLVSLRGGLYLFCDRKPFGQVYNPRSKSWSVLPEPPGIVDSSKCNMVLRTSLGESHGKILVYGLDDVTDDKSTHFHVYDLDYHQWTSSPSTFELDANPLQDSTMLGKSVVKEEDHNSTILYFMDKRGLIYALDWLNKEIFCGPIIGVESEDLVNRLKSSHSYNTFFHIWGDLFCFLWTTCTRPEEDYEHSYHHFTFLRLVNDSKSGYIGCSLTAYVVGCLQDTVDNYYQCYDALLV